MRLKEKPQLGDEGQKDKLRFFNGLRLFLSSRLRVFADGISPEVLSSPEEDLILACGLGNAPLAREIAENYKIMYGFRGELCETMRPLSSRDRTIFPDYELRPKFSAVESRTGLRNKIVFII